MKTNKKNSKKIISTKLKSKNFLAHILLFIFAIFFCIFIILNNSFDNINLQSDFLVERAIVHDILGENLQEDFYIPNIYIGSQRVMLEILSGNHKGQFTEAENRITRFHNIILQSGQEILVSITDGLEYITFHDISIYGNNRFTVIITAFILLCLAIILINIKKGYTSVISLLFTFIVVIFFMIDRILLGGSPVFYSIITAFLTTSFNIFFSSGFGKKSAVAIISTWTGLITAIFISVILSNMTNISGINLEDARQVMYHTPSGITIDIRELFFAVIIIASSGAMLDTSISVTSHLFQLKEYSKISKKEIFKSGITYGGDIIGANASTLILALFGSSLVGFMLIILFDFPFLRIINLDFIAVEVIKVVSAAFGLLITIPVAAILGAKFFE
ncbi:MAG: YibE/F family protein [Defluviitaleaceae bacterium]|nr:YibE/F family protein [Defluviitaleaceae bacterium]